MIYTKKKYAAVFNLPDIKGPVDRVTLSWGRNDKNIALYDYSTKINLKKKVSKSKPTEKRFEEVVLKFSKLTVIKAIGVSRDGGLLDIIGREHPLIPKIKYIKPSSVQLTAYYKKKDKLKVLYQYSLTDSFAPGNIHWAMNAWAHFFAIDTNTRDVDGFRVSITSVIHGCIKGTENGTGIYKFDTYYTEANANLLVNPETFAICKLISKISKEYELEGGVNIGIITDCELGLIDTYNSRTQCFLPDLFPGLYLPPNFHIMYATAEAARDTYMPNKMMAMCESAASDAFKNLVIESK